ncbi:MAG: zinc-ribbon domain-containing protein [Lachnospiraceae bacterium]|nr:zinc-ribbon domain-containing protein [Lachnospiraceae bacterium]
MKCPNCGQEIADGSKFCIYCGSVIEEKPAPAPVAPEAPVAEEAPKMQPKDVCSKCGEPLAPGAKFCTNCGTKREETPAPAPEPVPAAAPAPQPAPAPAAPKMEKKEFCTGCGKELAPGVMFCTNCGTKRGEAKAPAAAPKAAPKPAPAPALQPAPAPAPQKPAKAPKPPKAPKAPKQPKEKKGKGGLIFLIILLILVLLAGGGYFYLSQVQGVDPIEYVTGFFQKDKDADTEDADKEEDKEEKKDATEASESQEAGEVDLDELFKDTDASYEEAKKLYDEQSYTEAIDKAKAALEEYTKLAADNEVKEGAKERVQNAYKVYTESIMAYSAIIEPQNIGAVGYETMSGYTADADALTESLKADYELDSANYELYSQGLVNRYRDKYIAAINDITNREQWSRDEAWSWAEEAYSIQKDGKLVMFDETALDDPLRLRYVYCLAWITTKRCETGVADGSMSAADAANAIASILKETDYNPILIQEYINYASAAGMDTSNAQSAYNDVVNALKTYQNLSIVNTGVNSGTSVDLKHFWYFNDLDGEDQYKVDIHNGTTKETREWIRTNVAKWFAE